MAEEDRSTCSLGFVLEDSLRGVPDQEILQDLRRSAKSLGRNTITMAQYLETGRAHPSTIQRRFGSWPRALELAGLAPSRSRIGIGDEELFDNMRSVWIRLGRQPRYTDIRSSVSLFSAGTYEKRFGSWSKALRKFVAWANASPAECVPPADEGPSSAGSRSSLECSPVRRTRREISERQRFRVLLRDGFRCTACGASPLRSVNIDLHVDHIIPWSKGGETIDENLTTKCKPCNLGKGNAFDL